MKIRSATVCRENLHSSYNSYLVFLYIFISKKVCDISLSLLCFTYRLFICVFSITGGWTNVTNVVDMRGSVAIEFANQTYVTALDNGLFTLGAPHNEGN